MPSSRWTWRRSLPRPMGPNPSCAKSSWVLWAASPDGSSAMASTRAHVAAAAAAILSHGHARPRVGIILGTGLSGFADEIDAALTLPYDEIPHFARSTAPTHRGALVMGELAGVPLVAMAG